MPPDILLDPIPPDILLDSQVDSIARAPLWGERRGDGDHHADVGTLGPWPDDNAALGSPFPYADPGDGPEVIGALCGRGLNDWKRY